MNHISLLGRTTADLELKATTTGKSVVSFSLAVKRPFTKDTTDFFDLVAFDKQAEVLSKYVQKGQLIAIEGYLTKRTYEYNGQKRTVSEIIVEKVHFASSKSERPSPSVSVPNLEKPMFSEITDIQNDPDELPF